MHRWCWMNQLQGTIYFKTSLLILFLTLFQCQFSWDWSLVCQPTVFFVQCVNTVGWAMLPVKVLPEMTFYVSPGGTLNLTHSPCSLSLVVRWYTIHNATRLYEIVYIADIDEQWWTREQAMQILVIYYHCLYEHWAYDVIRIKAVYFAVRYGRGRVYSTLNGRH